MVLTTQDIKKLLTEKAPPSTQEGLVWQSILVTLSERQDKLDAVLNIVLKAAEKHEKVLKLLTEDAPAQPGGVAADDSDEPVVQNSSTVVGGGGGGGAPAKGGDSTPFPAGFSPSGPPGGGGGQVPTVGVPSGPGNQQKVSVTKNAPAAPPPNVVSSGPVNAQPIPRKNGAA